MNNASMEVFCLTCIHPKVIQSSSLLLGWKNTDIVHNKKMCWISVMREENTISAIVFGHERSCLLKMLLYVQLRQIYALISRGPLKHEQVCSSNHCWIAPCHLSPCCTCFWEGLESPLWSPGWRTRRNCLSPSWNSGDAFPSRCWDRSTRWCRRRWERRAPRISDPGSSGSRWPLPTSGTPWWRRRRAPSCKSSTGCPSQSWLDVMRREICWQITTKTQSWETIGHRRILFNSEEGRWPRSSRHFVLLSKD